MKTAYKLTTQELTTHNRFQWTPGGWSPLLAGTELCSNGVYHAYPSPELAVILNPIHANLANPRLWKCSLGGGVIDNDNDNGLKLGAQQMRLDEEIALPSYTTTQRIAFGILCVLEVSRDEVFRGWAEKWLSGEDRSAEAAQATYGRARWWGRSAVAMAAWWAARQADKKAARWAADAVQEVARSAAPLNLQQVALKALTFS